MYLRSLEITGFKSFPEKIELKFSTGITAVIGPNGCGKSNLLDAIRWVLGEQSPRTLRGSKMEELIFSGSAKRKALNFAEVKLTLDEAENHLPVEYKEVVITRRLYRSGEGEYFLNNTPCRLKDIYELFWDTGIGRETYSLIGQGRIEQLINARPEDNRELFEEAAEVHKYKQRKKEALARMEEVNRNLIRVEDLLGDLNEREFSLKGEVARATRYKELLGEYRQAEKGLLARHWWESNLNLQSLQDRMCEIEAALEERKAGLESCNKQVENTSPKIEHKKRELENAENRLREQRDRSEKRAHELLLLREQEGSINEKISYKEQSHKEIKDRISGLQETIASQAAELARVSKEQEHISGSVSSLQEQLSMLSQSDLLQELEKLRQQLEEQKSRKAAVEQSQVDRRHRAEEIQARRIALQEKLEAARSEYGKAEKKSNRLSEQVEKKRQQREKQESERYGWQEHLKDLQKEAEEKSNTSRRLSRELEQKKARLKYLQESQEELSLYSGGVKAVMHAARENPVLSGIHGPVAELIRVPPRFEKAVDTALGGSLQNIVAEDDVSARRAIELLKEKKAGRATFLPLNMLRPFLKKELPASGEGGLLGRAHELVETEPRFQKVTEYLLGNVLVTETLEVAVELSRTSRSSWKIVTLDGEMITPGGAISGGTQARERSGILSRKRELQELEKEVDQLQSGFEAAARSHEQADEKLARARFQLEKLDKELTALEKEEYSLGNELEKAEQDKKRKAEEIEKLRTDVSQLQHQHSEALEACASLDNEIDEIEEEIQALQMELQELSGEIKDNEERYRQLEKELIEARVRFSSLQEKESALQEMYNRQVQEKERLERLEKEAANEEKELKKKLQEIGTQKKKLQLQKEQSSEEIEKYESEVQALKEELQLLESEEKDAKEEMEKKRRQVERYRKRRQELDIEQVRAAEGEKYLQQQLQEKYSMHPQREISASFVESLEEESTLEEKKNHCAQELSSMGEVNLGVLEEYERIQQRVAFLEEQRRDLLEGEKGIKEVVAELERHIKKRFMDALREIENNFQEVFQQLFGGGQAYLKLTDPENVLEAGVEIAAQPPGKQLKNISLLSGGEKALTAIALLFALLKYKPVPFCVLDEVDSSLDENNLSRFILFLKRYTHNTQFILITHRKLTMEEADVLYGVTMEEQGISKAVSLSLSRKVG